MCWRLNGGGVGLSCTLRLCKSMPQEVQAQVPQESMIEPWDVMEADYKKEVFKQQLNFSTTLSAQAAKERSTKLEERQATVIKGDA
eukprot:100213-Amphidinium_carterae.1